MPDSPKKVLSICGIRDEGLVFACILVLIGKWDLSVNSYSNVCFVSKWNCLFVSLVLRPYVSRWVSRGSGGTFIFSKNTDDICWKCTNVSCAEVTSWPLRELCRCPRRCGAPEAAARRRTTCWRSFLAAHFLESSLISFVQGDPSRRWKPPVDLGFVSSLILPEQ